MPKTSSDRRPLQGPTMGSHWSVTLDLPPEAAAIDGLQQDLQAAVDAVDAQMSTWRADSALMQFNAAPCGDWVALPRDLLQVLAAGLRASALTGGAFEMNMGDAVRAWGFGPVAPDLGAIRAASAAPRLRAADALDLDLPQGRARKSAPLALDLSGIAKGFGVDRLAAVLAARGIGHALCAIDGELRALGGRADCSPFAVAIETPDSPDRAAHSMLGLQDAAVATSGDYRHFTMLRGRRLSHTMDPRRGAPLTDAPASVSVIAQTATEADAMATALMVMGAEAGLAFAHQAGLSCLILPRGGAPRGTGLFAEARAEAGLAAPASPR